MKKIILLHKKEGETPLEALEKFKRINKEYKNIKMTYAGRLDPMASGLMLVLAGKEVRNKEKYLALPKEYEFEVLFGFATDTYDILGKVNYSGILENMRINNLELKQLILNNLKHFKGTFIQQYPLYSSKTVSGKALFAYGRAGEAVERPERKVTVKELEFLKLRNISAKKLLQNIEKRIAKVKGDFRQKEILKIWRKNLTVKHRVFNMASFKIKCSSGTYVRAIANDLGVRMGMPALALRIKRTRIGKWSKAS